MFSILTTPIAKAIATLGAKKASDLLTALLCSSQASQFATERLRDKYEAQVLPAIFDNIASNFRLSKQDFIDVFSRNPRPSIDSLTTQLKVQLRHRAANWIHNPPSEKLFEEMVDDFYKAYEAFFITTDPGLGTLRLLGASEEITRQIDEIKSILTSEASQSSNSRLAGKGLKDEFLGFLRILHVPFEIIEEGLEHVDLALFDPISILDSKIFICAGTFPLDRVALDAILSRVIGGAGFSHRYVITQNTPASDVVEYGLRRGFECTNFQVFRQLLLRLSPSEQYVLGSTACEALLNTYGISEVYVAPHCALIEPHEDDPGEEEIRHNALRTAMEFITSDDGKLLCVLGEYGCGKTSFCAKLLSELTASSRTHSAIYVALRQLKSSELIVAVVNKASHLVRSMYPERPNAVVILDGIDELVNAFDPREKRGNILRLLEACNSVDKLVVTARSSYFRGTGDFWALFASGGDTLWDRIAMYVPATRTRPMTRAILLHDFNNSQIYEYIRFYASAAGKDDHFADDFVVRMEAQDPRSVYRFLARSPLYLFLLVQTEPWNDPSVRCSADVLRTLIRFWLERDIEKGPSRWAFSTTDRLEFITALAWWMFERGRLMLSFVEFDSFVREFYEVADAEYEMMSLDLHTTGLFSSDGNCLHFALPAFLDVLIADGFAKAKFPINPPKRLPTGNQARVWLGMLLTGQTDEAKWQCSDASDWIVRMGILKFSSAPDLYITLGDCELYFESGKMDADFRGITYHGDPIILKSGNPRLLNQHVVLFAALSQESLLRRNSIRILISNRLGLHARPSALFVRQAVRWSKSFATHPLPKLWLRRDGMIVEATSIMGVMMLACGHGAIVDLVYEHCTRLEVESLLISLQGDLASEGAEHDWSLGPKAFRED